MKAPGMKNGLSWARKTSDVRQIDDTGGPLAFRNSGPGAPIDRVLIAYAAGLW